MICYLHVLVHVSADDDLKSRLNQQSRQRESPAERQEEVRGEEKAKGQRMEGWPIKRKTIKGKWMGGKEAMEANRCPQGHINHTLPVWQIDCFSQISPSAPTDGHVHVCVRAFRQNEKRQKAQEKRDTEDKVNATLIWDYEAETRPYGSAVLLQRQIWSFTSFLSELYRHHIKIYR